MLKDEKYDEYYIGMLKDTKYDEFCRLREKMAVKLFFVLVPCVFYPER